MITVIVFLLIVATVIFVVLLIMYHRKRRGTCILLLCVCVFVPLYSAMRVLYHYQITGGKADIKVLNVCIPCHFVNYSIQ